MIPLDRSEPAQSGPVRNPVLIADNDRNVAEILRAFLVRRGIDVDLVADGRAAHQRIRVGDVALLVCDLDMPVMSGDALLDALRDDPACPPVIVISGFVDRRSAERLERHPSVVSILRKPFDVRRFAEMVATMIRRTAAPERGTSAVAEPGDLFAR